MSRHQVIIDTDPGVDDAAAILLAMASPEIDLLGISVVAGNVGLEASLVNACKLAALAGYCNLPVLAGASRPLIREPVLGKYAHVGRFADDLVPPTDLVPQPDSAIRFIAERAREAARRGGGITLCAIGPLTNIALALRLHPEVAPGIRQIVMMGGAFAALGHRTPWSEYNIHADPHAADVVWRSGVPLTLLPLDVTFQALFTEADFSAFEARDGVCGRAMAELLRAYDRSDEKRFGRPGGPVHDAMAVAWLLRPELFHGREAAVGVTTCGPTAGHSWADFHGVTGQSPNAHVIDAVDEAGYRRLVTERIAGLGATREAPEGREIVA
ncbi:nucleoside hydrolase [Pelagibacterium sediminicola]|uniref:nucleoside hydrolase n=1 Tax=Pelagibacterium sediminicola TaxID=2248761 RepID=UPI000E320F65|nr:nucleoside hydrolase [Pelagibacterium sediminicola]